MDSRLPPSSLSTGFPISTVPPPPNPRRKLVFTPHEGAPEPGELPPPCRAAADPVAEQLVCCAHTGYFWGTRCGDVWQRPATRHTVPQRIRPEKSATSDNHLEPAICGRGSAQASAHVLAQATARLRSVLRLASHLCDVFPPTMHRGGSALISLFSLLGLPMDALHLSSHPPLLCHPAPLHTSNSQRACKHSRRIVIPTFPVRICQCGRRLWQLQRGVAKQQFRADRAERVYAATPPAKPPAPKANPGTAPSVAAPPAAAASARRFENNRHLLAFSASSRRASCASAPSPPSGATLECRNTSTPPASLPATTTGAPPGANARAERRLRGPPTCATAGRSVDADTSHSSRRPPAVTAPKAVALPGSQAASSTSSTLP